MFDMLQQKQPDNECNSASTVKQALLSVKFTFNALIHSPICMCELYLSSEKRKIEQKKKKNDDDIYGRVLYKYKVFQENVPFELILRTEHTNYQMNVMSENAHRHPFFHTPYIHNQIV